MEHRDSDTLSPFQKYCLDKLSPLASTYSPPKTVEMCNPFTDIPSSHIPHILWEDRTKIVKSKSGSCKCKRTRCLKLYCDCFAKGEFCQGCACTECHNTPQFSAERSEAVQNTLERNPEAFRRMEQVPANTCNCRKSGCKKKYCECYQRGRFCNAACRCQGCLNS